jgi:hypothetical protein
LIRVNSKGYDVPFPVLVHEVVEALGPGSKLLTVRCANS